LKTNFDYTYYEDRTFGAPSRCTIQFIFVYRTADIHLYAI